MRLNEQANNIEKAVFNTIAEGKSSTGDLGGKSSLTQYTKAIISKL